MAKTCMIEREKRRSELVTKYSEKREEYKKAMKSAKTIDDIRKAQAMCDKLPRDSSSVRRQNRCQQCGRPRAVYRKACLCRICLRQHLMTGDVAGGRKSSW